MQITVEAILLAVTGPLVALVGYIVRRWLLTEQPFIKTIKHQERQIENLRRDLEQERAYVLALAQALREAGLDVPLHPSRD